MDYLYVCLGLVLLYAAGETLVKGAVELARRLGIPSLLVGLTVVSFGTSAPEMIVAVQAVRDGAAGIALGNVVGSNIANVLLILGIPAMITTIRTSQTDSRRSYLMLLAATALFIVLCFLGPLGLWHALILLAMMALVVRDNIRTARAHRAEQAATLPPEPQGLSGWKTAALILGGLVGLSVGADLLVRGAVAIATSFRVDETVIGLTIVAVGTSVPEMTTSIVAALRRQADVAIGNAIGSNLFNLLGIIGLAGLFGQIPVPLQMRQSDLWVMAAATLLLFPFVLLKRDVTRMAGVGLVGLYMAFMVSLVV